MTESSQYSDNMADLCCDFSQSTGSACDSMPFTYTASALRVSPACSRADAHAWNSIATLLPILLLKRYENSSQGAVWYLAYNNSLYTHRCEKRSRKDYNMKNVKIDI